MDSDVQTYVTSQSDDEGYAGRIEIVSGPTGRRRWPEHVKAALVLESYQDGVSVADVSPVGMTYLLHSFMHGGVLLGMVFCRCPRTRTR